MPLSNASISLLQPTHGMGGSNADKIGMEKKRRCEVFLDMLWSVVRERGWNWGEVRVYVVVPSGNQFGSGSHMVSFSLALFLYFCQSLAKMLWKGLEACYHVLV